MTTSLGFLIAARRCEIDELDQLARTSELVGTIGRLVHALQRERGLTNVFLGSGGQRFAAERTAQAAESGREEARVRAALDPLLGDSRRLAGGARLFPRVAYVLQGLDALPALRTRIEALAVGPDLATAAFVKLIAGLLAVVFEAADGATDPDISRWLVAMFNFMQGKEFAGQERAFGAAAFLRGGNDDAQRQQWLHLIESQERCFGLFCEFSDESLRSQWQASQAPAQLAELERLRRIGCTSPAGTVLDANLGPQWFEGCTRRIDAMQAIEDGLARELRALCGRKIEQARAELQRYEALQAQAVTPGDFFAEPAADAAEAPGTGYGRNLERSVLQMVQEQSRRLQAMSDELQTVRASLNERKVVERAKGLLMAHRKLSEEEAHKMLRQTAMNQNRRLVDVAESVLAMADFLPLGGNAPR
ncbi:nitrate regulatory protein [Pseudacidovorax intermedius]|uniref:Antitermination regulator n=1 Tax=Pseudacidovorax intermedius TaxID=433924 RepID=A0A147GZH3_9BURK|nr:nitrate regulatory protein [Pseudacidovorax intermedius]KTT22973.1 antitermination regulator [Pseudacidovorax intermedius]